MAGHEPIKDPLILTLGADFVHKYRKNLNDPDIPEGTTARIELYTSKDATATIGVWNAALVGIDEVYFRVESEQTDLIPNRSHYRLYVSYPDEPTLDMCWFYGEVSRSKQ